MKVEFRREYNTVTHKYPKGAVIDLTPEQADQAISDGAARPVKAETTVRKKPAERATVDPTGK